MISRILKGPSGKPEKELYKFSQDPFSYLDDCVEKYGDIFQIPFTVGGFFKPSIILGNPEAIQTLNSPAVLPYLENIQIPAFNELLGGCQHIAAVDKAANQKIRKLIVPFLKGKSLQFQVETIWKIAQDLSREWRGGEPFWTLEAMHQLTLENTIQIIFGVTEGSTHQRLKQATSRWLSWSASSEVTQALYFEELRQDQPDSAWGKHLQNLRAIYDILYTEIERTKAEPDPRGDLLSTFVAAQDDDGNRLTDACIAQNLLSFLIAGYENSANSMTWILYALHSNPKVLEELWQELKGLDEPIDLFKILDLPYLDAVCKEVLRCFMGVTIGIERALNAPLDLMGYTLEPGTILMPSSYLLNKRSDLYPEPEAFRPERFLNRNYGSHEWAMFGGGHRRCPGDALALTMMKLVISCFLLQFRMERLDDIPIKVVMKGLQSIPERDFQLQVIP
jgi:unspecific monooxygenase